MKDEQKLIELIRNLGEQPPTVIQGECVSVDEDNYTCVIAIDEAGEITQTVRLSSVFGASETACIQFPAEGAIVLAARILGADKWVFVSANKVNKVYIRGSANGSLINIDDLVSKLNALVSDFNSHTHGGVIVAVTGGSGAPAVGTPGNSSTPSPTTDAFNAADIENENIKHG